MGFFLHINKLLLTDVYKIFLFFFLEHTLYENIISILVFKDIRSKTKYKNDLFADDCFILR